MASNCGRRTECLYGRQLGEVRSGIIVGKVGVFRESFLFHLKVQASLGEDLEGQDREFWSR